LTKEHGTVEKKCSFLQQTRINSNPTEEDKLHFEITIFYPEYEQPISAKPE